MSDTTITIDGNYNESNLILSSGSASIHSADSVPAVSDTTPRFGGYVWSTRRKRWELNDYSTARIFTQLDWATTDNMRYNTSTPETIVPRITNVKTCEFGDYLNYCCLQIDNTLSEANKQTIFANLDASWNAIVTKAKLNSGFKYELNTVALNNNNPNDVNKIDVYLVIVSSEKLSNEIVNDISNLGVNGDFIFKIANSRDSVIYALANGPYGGAKTNLVDLSINFFNYVYIFEKDVAWEKQLYNSALTHGSILTTTHNFINAPAIMTRDGPRIKTNNLEIVGTYHEFEKDGKEYACYACICCYAQGDIVNEITAHVVQSATTGTLEVNARGTTPASDAGKFSYGPLFDIWYEMDATYTYTSYLTDAGVSAIDILSATPLVTPTLDQFKMVDLSGVKITDEFLTLWTNWSRSPENNVIPTILNYIQSTIEYNDGAWFGNPEGGIRFFYKIRDGMGNLMTTGDPFTYQMAYWLQYGGFTFTGAYSELNDVTDLSFSVQNLVTAGFATAS